MQMTAPLPPDPARKLALPMAAPPTGPDVALAAGGDRGAFERLYRRHLNHVFSLCARMCGDRSVAEELTQDVFVRVWEKLGLYRGESAFGTWLHRVAVNVVLTHRKSAAVKRGRETDDMVPIEERASRGSHPGVGLDLEHAIATLPPGARRIFVLFDVEGYRHEEIADMLGITVGGSKAQLHRARMLLREVLDR